MDFKNEQDQTIGIKENEPNKIRQILRMHFANQAKIKGKVLDIKDLGHNKEAEILIEKICYDK